MPDSTPLSDVEYALRVERDLRRGVQQELDRERSEIERLRLEVSRLHKALTAKITQLHDALSGAPDDAA